MLHDSFFILHISHIDIYRLYRILLPCMILKMIAIRAIIKRICINPPKLNAKNPMTQAIINTSAIK